VHQALIVGPRALRHALSISLARHEFAEQPIDSPKARDAFERLSIPDLDPFIEQTIERSGAAAFAVWPASGGVVIRQQPSFR
jgi:hypothetical protein